MYTSVDFNSEIAVWRWVFNSEIAVWKWVFCLTNKKALYTNNKRVLYTNQFGDWVGRPLNYIGLLLFLLLLDQFDYSYYFENTLDSYFISIWIFLFFLYHFG